MKNKRGFTGYYLKWIALITMLIDHIAAVVILRIFNSSYRVTGSMQLSERIGDKIIVWVAENQNLVYSIYEWMRCIGRMAFPIYCFLLVEGFLHTRNVAKYARRLAVFALISEIPFDWAIAGEWCSLEYSNVFFTLTLGLLTIWGLFHIEKYFASWKENKSSPVLGDILAILAGLIVVVAAGSFSEYVLHADYGMGGILTIVILYLLRGQRVLAFATAVCALAITAGEIELYALFMLYPIMRYNGIRGKNMKMMFYVFYPAHLLVLVLVCVLLAVCRI